MLILGSVCGAGVNGLGVFKRTKKPVDTHLLTAYTYSILATAITNTGVSSCNWDCGSTTATIAGSAFAVGGTLNLANAAAAQALADCRSASLYYKSLPPVGVMTGDCAGQVFTPGAWFGAAAVTNSATIYFDAQGDPDAVFVLNFGAAFAPAAGANNVLLNGALTSNIYITAVGAISTGAGSSTYGNIMCDAAITMGAGSSVTGRILSHTAALTLANNAITTI